MVTSLGRGVFSVLDQPEEHSRSGDGIGVRVDRTGDVAISARHLRCRLEGKIRVPPTENDGIPQHLHVQGDEGRQFKFEHGPEIETAASLSFV